MNNIAIIGGSGFVGSRLLQELVPHYTLANLDKVPSYNYNNITRLVDIRDRTSLIKQLKGFDTVILLAAEHRDDITPTSLYYDVNVQGTRNVLEAMDINGISRIFFTSSVAVYGLNKVNPDESHPADPFNHYGKSKWEAEEVLREWYYKDPLKRDLKIIRPTVIFGERNRGNVYNLLTQIANGRFLMIGDGNNCKSMAYVGNIVAVIRYALEYFPQGYEVFNYVDTPDFNMNQLVAHVSKVLHHKIPTFHFPKWFGMLGGYGFDFLAKITGKKLTVSSVRIRKFCATTQFNASKIMQQGFKPPFTLSEGLEHTLTYEFLDHPEKDDITYKTE